MQVLTSLIPALIVRPYESLIRQLVTVPLATLLELTSTHEKSLTLLLLLDQLSRNTMRGPATAWVYLTCDPVCVQLAQHYVKEGHDKLHPPYKRLWYYLPFAHSESLANQEIALAKNAQIAYETRESEWKAYHSFNSMGLDHSIKYYRIIEQFGRFPHRNTILNRDTTDEEQKFLDAGGAHA
jgi:uncharacterized protein (DUF924 family)